MQLLEFKVNEMERRNHMNEKEKQQQMQKKAAVALSYDKEDQAPKIVASGRGILADKIIDVAQESSVPIHKDAQLANTLSKLEIGDYIPPELYEVVAEILVFVDNMDRIKSKVLPNTEN